MLISRILILDLVYVLLTDDAINHHAVLGFFMRFEDDSVESAKVVKQWNVKIISVCNSSSSSPFVSL